MSVLARYLRSTGFLFLGCLGVVVLADVLFFGHVVGWTLAGFAGVLGGLLVMRRPGALRRWAVRGAVVFVLGMVVALAMSPTWLAILLTVVGLGVLSVLTTSPWVDSVRVWLMRGVRLGVGLFTRVLLDQKTIGRYLHHHPSAQPGAVRAGKAWMIPVVLGAVFVGLFTVANPVIAEWFRDLGRWLGEVLADWAEYIRADRMGLWIGVLFFCWGLLRPRHERGYVRVRVPPRLAAPWTHAPSVVRCLVLFNMIFGIQTLLDVVYLWAGRALPHGLTYAEYAHRGAYPLVATALLAGVFVLLTFRQGGHAEKSSAARGLVYLWIGQNVFLMFSTMWRMVLYVDVYSLSRWRVATLIWMGLVAMGFVWTIGGLWLRRDNLWLLQRNMVTAIVVMYVCAFVNFDGMIAWYNVQHCREVVKTGDVRRPVEIDLEYLRELGAEGLPAMEWIGPYLEGKKQEAAVRYAEEMRGDLREELGDWRGWTVRRWVLASYDDVNTKMTRHEGPRR